MDPAILGLVVDSSIIIDAERGHQSVAELLAGIQQSFGSFDIVISAVTVAELVHGVARAQTPEIRDRRLTFIDELTRNMCRSIRSLTLRPKSPGRLAVSRPRGATPSRSMIS